MGDDNCVVPGFFGGDDVLINGWMFCKSHGKEHCHQCIRDHRSTNNVQIEDDVTPHQLEVLEDLEINDLADRWPITVANKWKLLPNGKVACKAHSSVGCNTCFNFLQQFNDRVSAAEAQVNRALGAIDAVFQARMGSSSGMGLGAAAGANFSAPPPPPAAAAAQRPAAAAPPPPPPPAAAAPAAAGGQQPAGPTNACWECSAAKSRTVKLRKCGECRRAKYCSQECQLAHWPTHRPQCQQWAAAAAAAAGN